MSFTPRYNAVDPTLTEGQFNTGRVDSSGRLLVSTAGSSGAISTTNSSTTPLASNGVFTGTSINTLGYGSITVNVFANQVSATNGLSIQQSSDGTNWDITDTYTVAASTASKIVVPRQAAFMRVVYTNGVTLQTIFRLQTLVNTQMPGASSTKPADATTTENDSIQVISVPEIYNGSTLDMMRSVVNSANTTGTGILASGSMAQFDDVSITNVTENSFGNLRMSQDHVLYTSAAPTFSVGAGIIPVKTSVAAGSLVAKGSTGNLYGLNVSLPTGAVAQKIMIFDATSAPADGTVTPVKVYDVSAAGTFEDEFSPPIRFSTGIVIVLSTTGPFTKTIALTTNLGFISADIM